MKLSEFGRQRYLKLLFRQLTFQSARLYLRDHARGFRRIFSRKRETPQDAPTCAPTYEPPHMVRLMAEQAKLKLFGQLSVGDQGARELLDLLFAEPDSSPWNVPVQPAFGDQQSVVGQE